MSNTNIVANWLKPDIDVISNVFSGYGKVFVNWKGNKIPCNINGYTAIHADGTPCADPKAVDRLTAKDYGFWSSLGEAIRAYESNSEINGIGLKLGGAFTNTICIDLDDVEDVDTDERVQTLMQMFPTYTEISSSGHGIHIFIKSSVNINKRKVVTYGGCRSELEVFSAGKYVAITGKIISSTTDIIECDESLKSILDQLEDEKPVETTNTTTTNVDYTKVLLKADSEIYEELLKNNRIRTLVTFDGRSFKKYFKVDSYDKADESRLDMVLMNEIAYHSNNVDQMITVFKLSDLYTHRLKNDPKKADRDQYYKDTANKAIAYVKDHPRITSVLCNNDPDIVALGKAVVDNDLTDDEFAKYLLKKGILDKIRCVVDMKSDRNIVGYKEELGCWDLQRANVGILKTTIINEIDRLINIIIERYSEDVSVEPVLKYLNWHKNQKAMNNLISWIKDMSEIQMKQSDFDDPRRLSKYLHFIDMKLNLDTCEFEPTDIKDYNSKVCEFKVKDYLTDTGRFKTTGAVDKFIHEFFTPTIGEKAGTLDQDVFDYFMCALGYSLSGSNKEKAAFFLQGSGNTGKSVLMDSLGYMLNITGGKRSYFSNLDSSFLTEDKKGGNNDAKADSRSNRIGRINEMAKNKVMFQEGVKDFTGTEIITASRKFESPVTFINTMTIWVETNEIATTSNSSDTAFYNRIKIMKCQHIVEPEKQNKNLRDESKQDVGGWLNLFVDAAKSYKEKGLHDNQTIKDALNQYKEESSNILKFIHDTDVFDITGDECDCIKTEDIWRMFKIFLEENEGSCECAGKMSNFINTIMANHPEITKARKTVKGEKNTYLFGIRLKEQEVDLDQYF